jgi:hypothetical protein
MSNTTDGLTGSAPAKHARTGAASWSGIFVGPIAWAAQLYGSWVIGEVIACAPASRPAGQILGLGVATFTALLDGLLLCITIASGLVSWRELMRLRRSGDGTNGGRATWLASAGVMASGLFTIAIAASFLPLTMAGRC